MTIPFRKFQESEIRRILHVANSHEDKRAMTSTSLLLALSVPLYVQEYLHWKNVTLTTEWTSVNMSGRLLTLELPSASLPARYLSKLRVNSSGTHVFSKPTPDSPCLKQLNEELLIRANVLDCSHTDLLKWSRRQTHAFRRSL
jgi:hypothetical protein